MKNTPMIDEAFAALVPDERAAEALFLQLRWPEGPVCPHCGSRDLRRLATRPLWQCGVCRAQTSLRAGTVLHRTRTPLRAWLFASWRCAQFNGSARSIAAALGARYETVWEMVHKLRAALEERCTHTLDEVFALGTARIPVPKRANGDPPDRPPALVAVVVDPSVGAPDALRFEAPKAHRDALETPGEEALCRDALLRHVHRDAEPLPAAQSFGARAARRLRWWLTRRFGGVSRRYVNNYMAEYAYTENRMHHQRPRLFEFVARRLASEPWRPRADLALAAP